MLRSEVRGPRSGTADPQQFLQLNSRCCGRDCIERVRGVHQGADFLAPGSGRQGSQQHAGAPGRSGPANFAQTSPRQPAGKLIDFGNSAGDHFRRRRTSSREAAVTPASLGNAARCCKTCAGFFLEATTAAPPAAAEKSGEAIRTSKFSGNAEAAGRGCELRIRFLFAKKN